MKSITKHQLSESEITHLVKVNFGNETVIRGIKELKGGMFNSAYRIDLGCEDEQVILKVSAKPGTALLTYEKDIMRTEMQVYDLISTQTTIPIPKILHADFTKDHVESDYFFMTCMKGQVMSKIQRKINTENLNAIKRELGGIFAQIHKIEGPHFGYFTDDPLRRFTSWSEAFLSMNMDILRDGIERNVELPYGRIENVLKKNLHRLDSITVPKLVDYDLWTGNIFLTKEDNEYRVEGIVDFERAFWGDPYADFPPIFMLSETIWKDPDFWTSYSDTIGEKREVTNDDQIRITMYKMYIWIIMAVETYRYGFMFGLFQRKWATNTVLKCLKHLESV